MKGISDNAVKIISSAIGHHLDTVANNYDAWFLVWDYLSQGEVDCPNCADQASIATLGQTVLCKTHADEKHYAEMNEFFNDEVERIWFKPHTPFCSACGTDKFVVYVGVINNANSGPVVWSFCGDCRDKLTLKRNKDWRIMSEQRMADSLLYDLVEQHYKAHFVSEFCDNCVSSKPTRVICTRKLQRFFLCDNCAIKLHKLKRWEKNNERKKFK